MPLSPFAQGGKNVPNLLYVLIALILRKIYNNRTWQNASFARLAASARDSPPAPLMPLSRDFPPCPEYECQQRVYESTDSHII